MQDIVRVLTLCRIKSMDLSSKNLELQNSSWIENIEKILLYISYEISNKMNLGGITLDFYVSIQIWRFVLTSIDLLLMKAIFHVHIVEAP